jgi:hypothetical protein
MYWNVFKKHFIAKLLIISPLLVIFSCNDETESAEVKNNSKVEKLGFAEKIARQVESDLSINAAENYDLRIIKEYIDNDTLEDALILVNREEWSQEKLKKSVNKSFTEKTGNAGFYNHVFVKLGSRDELLKTPAIGSAPDFKLSSEFLTLTSQANKDFFVNYKIRNSMHRNYYTVRDDRLYLTFSCPVYDSIGEENPRVYSIQHKESSVRISKDIAMYKGVIEGYDPEKIENPDTYIPKQILPTDELIFYFIFDDKSMKYTTPMVPKKAE